MNFTDGRVPPKLNKNLVAKRYDSYGPDYEKRARNMGYGMDEHAQSYLGKHIRKNTILLDVAAGDGLATSQLNCSDLEIVSMDISSELQKVAKIRRPYINRFIEGDFNEPFPFCDSEFDYAVCVGALEFANNLQFTLREIFRVVKKLGMIFFTVDLLIPDSKLQREHIYYHGEDGFFSRRHATSEIVGLVEFLGGKIEKIVNHNAYKMEDDWVKYGCFLVRK